ncbi:hypothetical protein FB45DRAFT_976678 [Roridomyces roridus]|uniref:Proteasome alpha-type subunits domain-containing protein n=1 Tax=Roridomyces roridus TaxID=1738132 RepID=A0AAD7C5Z5_9AGAR|nr:hypothetical protein FB45DRAFT_976678 [Roridomyces roridus]
MNKNPFPPLPPGPPPPQPAQPDYSAYWASAGQPQPPSIGAFNQQWTAPQPPRPPADQSALYANYGYGTQNNHWRQQQQQQPQHYHPGPPPPPPAQPGYSPYQPTAGYQQPYVQAQPMAAAPYPHAQQPQTPQQQQFFPHPPPHPAPMQLQQQRNIHHTPPQHMPPAKRHNQNHRAPPMQPQFQPPTGPMQGGSFSGPPRGGGPGGNHVPLGSGNRGGPGAGPGRGGVAGRGGRGGGSMTGNRGGGMNGRGGRGGGNYSGGNPSGGRGGGGGGSVRGHNSRGNFGNKDFHNRRGGASFNAGGGGSFQNQSGSFRARGQNHANRGRNDGGGGVVVARPLAFNSGKKDENRRTLTDFKIVGLEIRELAWKWGVLPLLPVKIEPNEVSLGSDDTSQVIVRKESAEEDTIPAEAPEDSSATDAVPAAAKVVSDLGPTSRMRIYFHTPVTAGKRKKIESDDAPPPPGSVAPSADWLMAAIADEPESDSHGPDDEQPTDHDEATDDVESHCLVWMSLAWLRGNFTAVDNAPNEPDVSADPPGLSTSFSSDAVDDVPDTLSGPVLPPSDTPLVSSATSDDTPALDAPPTSASTDSDLAETQSVQTENSPVTLSLTATLVGLDEAAAPSSLAGEATVEEVEATQMDDPPPSLTVSAASTTYGEAFQPVKPETKGPKVPAANRLSISFEGGNRRIVFDAEVARAEVRINLMSDGETGFKGILMETLSEVTKSYNPIQSITGSDDFPPFSQATTPLAMTLIVYLDNVRPLSEPKWVKTGDIPEWLKSLFGRMFWFAGDAAESWEKKIIVTDPDPPPTLNSVLEGWSTSSSAGTLTERQRFLKTHMTEMDNVLEVLLRLVRGDRNASLGPAPAPVPSGPLLSALKSGIPYASQQTPVSLAVMAMFRMTIEYAEKSDGDKGKTEVEERFGEIVRCLPPSQIHKSLDAIFKDSFRNTYDSDNTVFSPQGRLHQVEYALEAVKQGSAAVGLRSKTHSILLALKRSTGELASYQQKMFRIDDHVGIAIAGLTSDARVLSNFMRQQAMSSKMVFNRPVPVNRLVSAIADKAQVNTQEYGRRPYGVGFLVIGQDQSGPHLYEFSPSGNSYEYYAMSIGARSQSAKTYLEKHYKSFEDCSLEDLIRHGLHALRETLQQDKELNVNNTSIGIIGSASTHEGAVPSGRFRILEGETIEPFLQSMEPKETETAAPAAAPAAPAAAPTDQDVQMEG